jgi:para-aminobenzoate synthetase component 1
MTDIWKLINEKASKREPFLFIIDFNCTRAIIEDLPISASDLLIDFPTYRNVSYPRMKMPFTFSKNPISYKDYEHQFNNVMKHLERGDTFLLNLTCATPIESSLGLKMLFFESNAPYRLHIPGKFTLFSPESFIKISENTITSYPMKGTIDASIVNAEEILLSDEKEIDEHNTIVDLIRNDLNSVATKVNVKRFRYIEKIETNGKALLQVSSEIEGTLPEDWHQQLGTILQKLLPAGSISGAPKPKTIEIIKETETDSRGYYTGVMGIFDGKSVDSAVMIRYIEQTPEGLSYHSGGGITINSTAESEYQELIDKVYVPTI